MNRLLFGLFYLSSRIMTGIFHPNHILYVKATEMAFEDSLYGKKWSEAVDFGSLCYGVYKKYTIGDQVKEYF